jgi:hypothetical protein
MMVVAASRGRRFVTASLPLWLCHEGGEGRDEGANSGVGRCDLLSRGVRDWYR